LRRRTGGHTGHGRETRGTRLAVSRGAGRTLEEGGRMAGPGRRVGTGRGRRAAAGGGGGRRRPPPRFGAGHPLGGLPGRVPVGRRPRGDDRAAAGPPAFGLNRSTAAWAGSPRRRSGRTPPGRGRPGGRRRGRSPPRRT